MIESTIATALREIAAVRAALDSLEARLVACARVRGATWPELADPLGLSKQGARKRHLAHDPLSRRPSQKPQTIGEYHAELVAAMRAQGVFFD